MVETEVMMDGYYVPSICNYYLWSYGYLTALGIE